MRSWRLFAVLGGAALAAVGVGLWARHARPVGGEAPARRTRMECGHWAVLRSCELHGVPVSPKQLVELMPAGPNGHSLLDIAQALRRAGLIAEGNREDIDAFLSGDGVRVVHLSGPDHFVVVTKTNPKTVFFLDDQGRRQVAQTARFAERWTGHVLRVSVPPTGVSGFIDPPGPGQARIVFSTLFIDKGDIITGADAKTVRFEFPFRNTGHAPLVIKKAHTSCSCLKSSHTYKPVPPGGTGAVVLEYGINPNKHSFVHDAVVETNDPAFPALALRAAGNTNVQVTLSPPSLALGDMPVGQEKRAFLFVRYNGEEDFEVPRVTAGCLTATVHSEPSAELARRVSLGAAMSLPRGTRVVEVCFKADGTGPVSDEVVIETNIERFGKLRVPVVGRVVPPVTAAPSLVSFGEPAPEATVTRSLLLAHCQGKPFRVLSVTPIASGLVWNTAPADGGTELRLSATGATALGLTGKALSVVVEAGGARFTLEVPVYAFRKAGP